jgi:hypothetical protein
LTKNMNKGRSKTQSIITKFDPALSDSSQSTDHRGTGLY